MNRRRWGRHVTAGVPDSARQHVRLVTRLLVAQAGTAAAVSLPFSRRTGPVVLAAVAFVAIICLLAAAAATGTNAARTVILGVEFVIAVFGLYRFTFERYLGGTIFAIVICTVLLHPAVVRAFAASSPRAAGRLDVLRDEGSAADPAGGALGESAGH